VSVLEQSVIKCNILISMIISLLLAVLCSCMYAHAVLCKSFLDLVSSVCLPCMMDWMMGDGYMVCLFVACLPVCLSASFLPILHHSFLICLGVVFQSALDGTLGPALNSQPRSLSDRRSSRRPAIVPPQGISIGGRRHDLPPSVGSGRFFWHGFGFRIIAIMVQPGPVLPVSLLKELLFGGHVQDSGGQMNDFGCLGDGNKWSTVTGLGGAGDENEKEEESFCGSQHDGWIDGL
jgi:hypothetical protein